MIFLLFLNLVFSDSDQAIQKEAYSTTSKQISNPKSRAEMLRQNPKAQAMDKDLKDLVLTDENQKLIYELAAEVLMNLQDQTPEQALENLQKAQRDPSSFGANWTPEQKKKLKHLVEQIQNARKQKP